MTNRKLRKNLAANLRRIAAKESKSLALLADFAGVSRTQMYNIARGEKAATIDLLEKLALAFGLEPWDLIKPVK